MNFFVRLRTTVLILCLTAIVGFTFVQVVFAGTHVRSRADIDPNPSLAPLIGAEDSEVPASESSAPFPFRFSPQATFQVGTTWMDMQQNGSMGRQIVLGGGWVHNVWNYLPAGNTSSRNTPYYGYQLSSGTVVSNPGVDQTGNGAGFCAVGYDQTSSGRVGVAYHNIADSRTKFAKQTSLGASPFTTFYFPAPGANCQGIVTGAGITDGPYYWPKVAVDKNSSEQSIAHLVSTEFAGAQVKLSLVYYRTNFGMTAPSATCGLFVDSVTTVAAVVEQDPNSDRVAVVWLRPADWAHGDAIQQRNNDVVYQESTDLGSTWFLPVAVTQYDGNDYERAYTDLGALYSSDGCLHIVWTTSYFDSASANVGNQGARLYHWDACQQCQSLLLDADNSEVACKRGQWNKNICKMSLSECTVGGSPRLYATYTYFTGDDSNDPGAPDCSQAGWSNGEIYAQVSPNGGHTWGPPVNLTNTQSHNCAAGNCMSEHWSSAAPYVTDSLRIQYILDTDAGAVQYSEGAWTNNPVMNLSYPCFSMTTYSHLTAIPGHFDYPLHTTPGQQKDTLLVLVNAGNGIANYSRSQSYVSGSGWLSFPNDPSNSTVPAGCTFADTLVLRINAPASQGFYQAVVSFTYNDGDSNVTVQVPIDLYNFNEFFLPTDQAINTTTNRLNVNQAGRIGNYEQGNLFTYTSSGVSYMKDGSLIIGTSVDNLSFLIYEGSGGQPTVDNPYGRLYAKSNLTYSTSHAKYQLATGNGVNRDSTIGFRVAYYAPKDASNSDFYLARFSIYPGPNNSTQRIENFTAAFATDWDIPSDDGQSNTGGGEDARQMVYQRGTGSATNTNRFGALAVIREDGLAAPGGFVWENYRYVNPLKVYNVDTLWNRMSTVSKFETSPSTGDLNAIIVATNHETIVSPDSFHFVIVVGGQLNGTLVGLQSVIDRAESFYCQNIATDQIGCPQYVCGDGDGNSLVTISDAVYIINYIFAGGPAPNPLLAGDCDCNELVTISDVVYLINYIFAGGQAPCAACP